ncbi:MAG: O-antigen ligase family protein [Sediminibacterium sp.]|nr:O-antigen ligase family protein [Sediminibacterium sp.]MDP1812102.1 O-antigen ligase family protein [Sediminibacterium sp.]MDP3127020.1 O-antigen ligase family protein [Sediminibacterium sp.]
MNSILVFGKVKYLPIFVLSFLFLSIPYFYNEKLTTGIFNTDIYLLWLAGGVCWLFSSFYAFVADRITIILWVLLLYVTAVTFFYGRSDSNSINISITLFASFGILLYLKEIGFLNKLLLFSIVILPGYLFQMFIGFRQFFNSEYDSLAIQGWLNNSGYYGNYIASIIPLLLSGWLRNIQLKSYIRLIFLVFFISAIFLMFATVARAAILGAIGGCIFVIWHNFRPLIITFSSLRFRWAVILPVIFLAIAGLLFLINLKINSASGRITIYTVCLNIIRDFPIIGVGPGRFSAVYNNYQGVYFQNGTISMDKQLLATDTFEAFNIILQILVEYGIVGVTILMFFIIAVKKVLVGKVFEYKNYMWVIIGNLGSLLTILISALFSNPFHCSPIFLIFLFQLAIVLSITNKNDSSIKKSIRGAPAVFGIFLVLNIGVLYYANKQHASQRKWLQASENAKIGYFDDAFALYENAYNALQFNGNYLYNYGAESGLSRKYLLSIALLEESLTYYCHSNTYVFLGDNYTATKQYDLAEKNYLKAVYITPSHIYPKYQLIQLYNKWGKTNKSKFWTIKTLNWPIKVKSPFTEELLSKLRK